MRVRTRRGQTLWLTEGILVGNLHSSISICGVDAPSGHRCPAVDIKMYVSVIYSCILCG